MEAKFQKIQAELKEKSDYEEKFNQDIEELSQETQSLVEEIDKWQTNDFSKEICHINCQCCH